jgi:hypothetical protein
MPKMSKPSEACFIFYVLSGNYFRDNGWLAGDINHWPYFDSEVF